MWKSVGTAISIAVIIGGAALHLPWAALDMIGRVFTLFDSPERFDRLIDWLAAHPRLAVDFGPWILIGAGLASVKVMYDFRANAKFIALFPPISPFSFDVSMTLPDTLNRFFELCKDIVMVALEGGDSSRTSTENMIFSDRLFIYMEEEFTLQQKAQVERQFETRGVSTQFCGHDYWIAHWQDERTLRTPPDQSAGG